MKKATRFFKLLPDFYIGKVFLLILIMSVFCSAYNINRLANAEDDKELFLVAQKAFEDGFYDVAIRYIEQLALQYPESLKQTQAQLLLGQCYFFKTQYLKAYEIFQKLLSSPEYKDATLYWLGETLLKGSDYKQAAQYYRQIIDIYPRSSYIPQAYYSLGWVYFDQKKYEEAQKSFSQLAEKFAEHSLAEDAHFKIAECEYHQQRFPEAIGSFEKYIELFPNSNRKAEVYFYIAEANYYQNNYNDAAGYYVKVIDISYDNRLTLMSKVSLGWSYLKQDKLEQARITFEDAQQFSYNKGIITDDVFLGQASIYLALKNYGKAAKAYDQLISQFPNSKKIYEAMLGKANALYMQENYKEAVNTYESIIKMFSENAPKDVLEKAYFGLAWSYLKNGDIDQCIKQFTAIRDNTTNKTVKISAMVQIGDAYQDAGQLESAVEIYDKVLKDFPESMYTDYVQYRQGVALLKMGKVDAATMALQTMQTNFPSSKYLNDVRYYLALSYFKKNDWQAAREQIDVFMNNIATNSEFYLEAQNIYALASFNMGDYPAALNMWRTLIKNNPGDVYLVQNAEINIAKAFYRSEDKKEAIKKFHMIIQKYPDAVIAQESLMWLGEHYLSVKEYEKAIGFYRQLINGFPGSAQLDAAYFELGQAFLLNGEYDKAISVFNKVDGKREPSLSAKAKLTIGEIFSRDLDPESALETYQNIIMASPQYARDAFVKVGELYITQRLYDKAAESFLNAMKAKGTGTFTDAEIQFRIGDTYELASVSDRAIDSYLKIPYLYPESKNYIVKAYLRIGRLFENSEQWDQAVITYEKVEAMGTDEALFARERIDWIKNTIEAKLKND